MDSNKQTIVIAWIGALVGGAIGGLGQIFGNREKRKEADKQHERQKELMDKQQEQQLAMFNKTQQATNLTAQMAQLKKEGINPALLYGGGGAGGQSVGAGQPGSTSTSGASKADVQGLDSMGLAQLALMGAQKKNIEADTKAKEAQAIETEARATKTVGVDTASAEENVRNQKFLNDVNEAVGVNKKADQASAEADVQQILMERMNADWETYKATAYGEKTFDDPNSLAGKIIQAGYVETLRRIKAIEAGIGKTNAEQAKIYQNRIIDSYRQNLAEEGINPDAQPIQKLIMDGLRKMGTPEEFKDKVNNFVKDKTRR